MNPIQNAQTTERKLVESIETTAQLLDTIATSELDKAMVKLRTSAEGAKQRITNAKEALYETVQDVLSCLGCFSDDNVDALETNERTMLSFKEDREEEPVTSTAANLPIKRGRKKSS